MSPPPGEGSGSWRGGRTGNSPSGEEGESELKLLEVDMAAEWLPGRNSAPLLPSSERPEPERETRSKLSVPLLGLLPLDHMIVPAGSINNCLGYA